MSKKPHVVTVPQIFWIVIGVCILTSLVYFVIRMAMQKNVLGTTTASTTATATTTSSGIKELYIPLGTGTNGTTDWTDTKGAAAYIDSRLYGKIKKTTFEASIGVPSGNQTAYVRLYNATDKHPVWYSEMTLSGAGPELLSSSAITLDSGNKLYQVQMKSQLGATTNLLQSRVHIITY